MEILRTLELLNRVSSSDRKMISKKRSTAVPNLGSRCLKMERAVTLPATTSPIEFEKPLTFVATAEPGPVSVSGLDRRERISSQYNYNDVRKEMKGSRAVAVRIAETANLTAM